MKISKLYHFCEQELYFFRSCGKTYGADGQKMIDRCYGAVKFFLSCCTSEQYKEVAEWWEDIMLPRLNQAI